ncbi:MAG: carbohydrate-binding family 9-like protein [Candidatus Krumholzibacteria bacterium]|nr:carbohydrate-binding family 9-like protein [Candidatus Krumholzibacteria bacterium]MDP6669702.1 carbohydrate-binding family 9-like protein [Candidatus Krumholzibacteria bacterium]MDP6796726.1 carbohydrate-binding family 9-like protein [Candidatus Krumholzibacteria bacterium]MDP7021317.1 carbohydrate-binding family 9-like protein [Candidatus Krumholzibacteria bacterium]
MRLFLVLLCLASLAMAFDRPMIETPPETYLCYQTSDSLIIDGVPEEGSWQSAKWTREFVDIEGDLKSAPMLRTQIRMLWDERFLYINAVMEEPDLWATLEERDAVIYQDNDFEVFIDPDGDHHAYYELEINALGTEWDLFLVKPYRDGGPALHAWDIAGLQTAVALFGTLNDPTDRDKGWSVEIAIPWSVLSEAAGRPSPPDAGDQWRMNFSRVEWDLWVEDGQYVKLDLPEHNWVWSAQGLVNMHYPERWGIVQFSRWKAGEGEDPFLQDPAFEIRKRLMNVYYLQKEFHEISGRYASDPLALGIEDQELELLPAPGGFLAMIGDWRVDEESRLWRESP